jgi:hypothetical protein
LEALLEEFHKNGPKILERAGQENPATFLKALVQLVPRELSFEHSGTILGKLSDEQLAAIISELESRIANQLSGESAKLINAQVEQQSEPQPKVSPKGWISRGAAGRRKLNPKSTPKALEYAREYGRKRREAAKAAKAARQSEPLSLAENER